MIDLFVLEKSPRSSSIPSIQSASGTTQVHTQHTPQKRHHQKNHFVSHLAAAAQSFIYLAVVCCEVPPILLFILSSSCASAEPSAGTSSPDDAGVRADLMSPLKPI